MSCERQQEASERQRKLVGLRREGFAWSEIAARIGISKAASYKLFKAWIERQP